MDLRTCFNMLGIDPQADPAEAKRAYKAMVRRWHPDQFPEGSPAHLQAEERLKQINIAYARVKDHLRLTRPAFSPETNPGQRPAGPDPESPRRRNESGQGKPKPSWVDHLFDRLNAFATPRTTKEHAPEAQMPPRRERRSSFQQVLGEMAGEALAANRKAPLPKPAPSARATHGSRRPGRRSGQSVDAIGGTDRIAPVRPVGRVRGIGRNR